LGNVTGTFKALVFPAGVAFDHAIAAAIPGVATARDQLIALEEIGHVLRIHLW